MTTRNNPSPVTTRSGSKSLATFLAAGAMLLLALLSLAALPATSTAAQPSSGHQPGPLLQADPTQALPTAQTDVTNQQGGSEEDQPLNGGSTDNNSNSGTTNNSTNNQQNPPGDDQQGSTSGGNAAGNTGGQDGTGMGFSWWLIVIPVILIAIALPFLRRRPANEPATANPAPDLERRDQA